MSFPKLEFQVESSSTGENYIVEVFRSGDNLTCTCTCQAAENGMHCKHRVSILRGDIDGVSGGDIDKVNIISQMLVGTDVEGALNQMLELEAQKAAIDKQLKAIKKQLGRVLVD